MADEHAPAPTSSSGYSVNPENKRRLIESFIRYAQIDTTANADSDQYPSSEGQRTLGAMLASELRHVGVQEVRQDRNGLVWGLIPASPGYEHVPCVLFNAHLDTSPEAPGADCKPQVIASYVGGPIRLSVGGSIAPESTPDLSKLIGHTLITSDGRTLLGGDDKAGVAAIMEIATRLLETNSKADAPLVHGPVQILFTCDEEIGRGTQHVDLSKIVAVAGFTLDGGAAGNIDVETFSADQAIVRFVGLNTHPSVGKGKMVNAIRGAAEFIANLPVSSLSPESTDGRDGFMHPYHIEGGVGETTVRILLRDFDTAALGEYAEQLRGIASQIEARFPGLSIFVTIESQYRNMGDGLKAKPELIEVAEQAYRSLGLPCRQDIIRGGTDGALLTAMGLPTPNLSVGQYNIHSTYEFVSVDEMEQAIAHGLAFLDLWAKRSSS